MKNKKKQPDKTKYTFSKYEKLLIAILAVIQFTIILDFMVLSPLGAVLIDRLSISEDQFSSVVAAYAFSAGISGLLASGFADKFDRKKLLIFFYSGFIIGTLLCGIAPNYTFLLVARIVTGIFGGVMSSITFAIITDLFPMQARGRVMGFTQMAFPLSQAFGIPLGLFLASKLDWHAPFLLIVAFSIAILIIIIFKMKPVADHLEIISDKKAITHLAHTISNRRYIQGFAATAFLAIGGFMLMPFTARFLVKNVGILEVDLVWIFMVTGAISMFTGPLVGRLSDKMGKYRLFIWGSILTMILMVIYTNLGPNPMWIVILINTIMFAGITSRMVTSGALLSGVPYPADRGAFMSINSAIQLIAGGVASKVGGLILGTDKQGRFLHFDIVGYVGVAIMILTIYLMWYIHKMVKEPGIHYPDKAAESDEPEVPLTELTG